ncbi:hypothetical protein ACFL6I_07715 [candidate division KSB1 bacterium]
MRKTMNVTFFALLPLFCIYTSPVFSQETHQSIVPRGILVGERWSPEKRELEYVYPDQTILDLGPEGVRTVLFWTEILHSAGKKFTWVVVYSNGMRQEVLKQQIRYDRFRTYLEKTFRRNLWNAQLKKLVDVSGPCRIMLIDPAHGSEPVAVRTIILK